VTIRHAVLADVPACTAIYNYWVEVGVSTFDEQPRSAVRGLQWYDDHRDPRYPLIVWELGKDLLGFGTLSRWSNKSGYGRSVEVSVFVSPSHQGQGGGRLLLGRLIALAGELRHHVLIGRIEASNKDSLTLFQRSGFAPVGVMREVGFKQRRWLDVFILERNLSP
jgi:L-amino acid N-acyltransferase YncA